MLPQKYLPSAPSYNADAQSTKGPRLSAPVAQSMSTVAVFEECSLARVQPFDLFRGYTIKAAHGALLSFFNLGKSRCPWLCSTNLVL